MATRPNAPFSVLKPHFPIGGLKTLSQRMIGDYFMSRCESHFSLPGIIYIFSQDFENEAQKCIEEYSPYLTFCQGVKSTGSASLEQTFHYIWKLAFLGDEKVIIRENKGGITPHLKLRLL